MGGAATAASFAVQLKRDDLIVPASAVGILGYMIGTPIGLWFSKVA